MPEAEFQITIKFQEENFDIITAGIPTLGKFEKSRITFYGPTKKEVIDKAVNYLSTFNINE